MVSSLSPSRIPSHVCMPPEEVTGIVPSPDSILVLSCPRALRFGCLSPPSTSWAASWGEKILESPHGDVLMYRWKWMLGFSIKPPPSFSWNIEDSFSSRFPDKCFPSWKYRYLISDLRPMTSAWQSLTARPWSLMYSPLIHLVPVETEITVAFSALSLVVMTIPDSTFLRAYGEVRLSVSSQNFSRTSRECS